MISCLLCGTAFLQPCRPFLHKLSILISDPHPQTSTRTPTPKTVFARRNRRHSLSPCGSGARNSMPPPGIVALFIGTLICPTPPPPSLPLLFHLSPKCSSLLFDAAISIWLAVSCGLLEKRYEALRHPPGFGGLPTCIRRGFSRVLQPNFTLL